MKKKLMILLAVILALSMVSCSPTANSPEDEAAEVAKVKAVYVEYAASVNDDDFERYMDLWDEGSIQLSPDAPSHIEEAQIREGMQSVFDTFDQTATINTEGVQILGEQAYAYGTFEITVTPKDGGEPFVFIGQFLDVLAKQDDGSWKIAIDCHNYYMPPE
jgi:uncharacterized protein (TIGR02246 family)